MHHFTTSSARDAFADPAHVLNRTEAWHRYLTAVTPIGVVHSQHRVRIAEVVADELAAEHVSRQQRVLSLADHLDPVLAVRALKLDGHHALTFCHAVRDDGE